MAAARLKKAIKAYGAQGTVATLAGVSRQSLVEILGGSAVPTNQTLRSVIAVIGIDETDLLEGDDTSAGGMEGLTLVPLHDVLVSAGYGVEAMEAGDSPDSLGFPKSWLRRMFGETGQLRVVQVKGDSMAPSLGDGDFVMIDLSRRDPVDGIFVLRLDDQLMVKRVVFPMARRVLITSDNRDYDRWDKMIDMESEAARDGFQLIGRVVWVGKAM